MSYLHRSAASLRFFGETLDPDEITALLGGAPTHFYRKGDLQMLKSDEARERPGQWRRVVERRTPGDLDGQIGELLGGLTEDLNVWKALAERFQGNIFCGLFMSEENEGIEISSQTLLLIGSRGLKFDFDVYAPGE